MATGNWKDTINGLGMLRATIASLFVGAAQDPEAIGKIAAAMYAEENFGGGTFESLDVATKTLWARRARAAILGIKDVIKGT